jgi:hypothetical protein
MANCKIVLRFSGPSRFKIAEQVRPGVTDDYGTVLPDAIGSWLVDETQSRTTSLGTTTAVHLIDYTAIPYPAA